VKFGLFGEEDNDGNNDESLSRRHKSESWK
jgi:hypothetical protein